MYKTMPMTQVTARKMPSQGRSKQTVARILDATRDLLETQGHKAITTPLVAKTSGVNVASIYQYFPNKHALFHHLYQEWLDDAYAKVEAARRHPVTEENVADITRNLFESMFDVPYSITYSQELNAAMQGHPELKAAEQAHQDRMAGYLGESLQTMRPQAAAGLIHAHAVALFELGYKLVLVTRDTPEEHQTGIYSWAQETVSAALTETLKQLS